VGGARPWKERKERPAGADRVAGALTEAVRPLDGADAPVELSLTGGKDSRLVAAALAAARVMNRAGRWSAAARQAYLLRSRLIQPLFTDRVVRAARAVPLRDRMSDRLHRDVLGMLCPELLDIPLAGTPWHGQPRTAATVLTAPARAAADWRRDYGDAVAGFLRGYVLDHGEASPVFGIVRRSAAERLLRAPQADRQGAWALATLTALLSGDWLNAREPASQAPLS
jgi:hypothetical protein